MHRLSVIEKLRERMGDEDKIVRETLYQLLKAVIFPECKEVFFFSCSLCIIFLKESNILYSLLRMYSNDQNACLGLCITHVVGPGFVFWL